MTVKSKWENGKIKWHYVAENQMNYKYKYFLMTLLITSVK